MSLQTSGTKNEDSSAMLQERHDNVPLKTACTGPESAINADHQQQMSFPLTLT